MLFRWSLLFTAAVTLGTTTAALSGAEMALVPVDADGPHVIVGNEITVQAGRIVFLEIRLSDWDADQNGLPLLRSWLGEIDSTGYSSGLQGVLTPSTPACSNDAFCQAIVHPAAECRSDFSVVPRCGPGFLDTNRPDGVFFGLNSFFGSDFVTLDLRFGDVVLSGGVIDPGLATYGATVVLAVPSDAEGTFTVGFLPQSNMADDAGLLIQPLVLTSARITIAPSADRLAPTNRYLATTAGAPGQLTSIRVTLSDLQPPFDIHNGRSMWVGAPRDVSTNSGKPGSGVPGFADFSAAPLQCEPHVADFGSFGIVEVYGRNIVPDSVYTVDVFDDAVPPNLITTSTMLTSRWGDTVSSFNSTWQFWESADGSVDVVTDAVAILDAFASVQSAPFKTRVDIAPATLDHRVTVVDAVHVLSAFSGNPYPFEPVAFPCLP